MKKTLIATAILATTFVSASAFATDGCYDCKPSDAPTQQQIERMKQNKVQQQQQQNSTSNSEAYAGNQGNSQTVVFQGDEGAGDVDLEIAKIQAAAAKDIARQTQKIENTPSVSGPSLTTSNDTCMGSTSGSINIAGLGIGGGTSWTDKNCVMLKNARELWNMGMKSAAMARMCHDDLNREALELTGFVCAQTARDQRIAAGVGTEDDVHNAAIVEREEPTYRYDSRKYGG